MWYPEVSLDKWLRMYPALKAFLPFHCSCGRELKAIPYVSSQWIGIESDSCECPLAEGFISGFPKSPKVNERELKAFVSL